MTHVIDQLEKQFSEQVGLAKKDWDADCIRTFQDKISEMASSNFFGFDINPDLVKAMYLKDKVQRCLASNR